MGNRATAIGILLESEAGGVEETVDDCQAPTHWAPSLGDDVELGLSFDLSVMAMLLIDESRRVVRANAAAERMLGAERLIGSAITDFSTREFSGQVPIQTDCWLPLARTHLEQETQLTDRSGQILTVQMRLDAITTPSGHRFFLAQLRDVTVERKQQRQLLAGREQYRQLVANLPDAVVLMVDRDMRVAVAAGEALATVNLRPTDMVGRLLSQVLPPRAWELLERRFGGMVHGRPVDFEYDSPTGGRQFRVRARPVRNSEGVVVGGLVVSEDVSEDRARRSQLDQINRLGGIAGSRYDRPTGWTLDPALIDLWGVAAAEDVIDGLPLGLIVNEQDVAEPDTVAQAWARARTTSGVHQLAYQFRHPGSSELRHVQSTHDSVVDPDGVLLRMISTHVDVTDTVWACERGEREREAAAHERRILLRGVADSMATSPLQADDLLACMTNLAATTLASGAVVTLLHPGQRRIERVLTAHVDDTHADRLADAARGVPGRELSDDPITAAVIGRGEVVSAFRLGARTPDLQALGRAHTAADAAHFMIAPIRHRGCILGSFAIYRTANNRPYQTGDDDVLEVLADKAGAVLDESRRARQQHGLLEQLAGMETRERHLLAESIHDEPIQHLVAGIMRLEMISDRLNPAIRTELVDIADELETTTDWLRNLIMVALSPPELSAGLGPALASLARGVFAGTTMAVNYEGPHHVPLPIPAKEMAYRIFREALLNVRKHAAATAVTLHVDVDQPGLVVLSLTDDGNGVAAVHGNGQHGIATMQTRAHAEGGTLTVNGSPGIGTTVTLTLPRLTDLSPADPRADLTPSAPPTQDADLRIVICDDRPEVRRTLHQLLSGQPTYDVIGQGVDGHDALDIVRRCHPDVLIMDFSMPGGGPDLVRAVKANDPRTRVVVFTGREDTHTQNLMKDAGADQYVVKTGRLRPLLDALRIVDHRPAATT